MSVSIITSTQEEYEDDFEKDLDWLISEESKSEEQDANEDIEAQIDKELEDDDVDEHKDEEEDERWPTPLEPVESAAPSDQDKDSEADEDLDEEKKYILEKIQEANKQLEDQEPPDQSRRRRLQFKDNLVDLVVPAPEFISGEKNSTLYRSGEEEAEMSGQLQRLKISSRDESEAGEPEEESETAKEGRVLVEKDGKFDFVSLKEVESQGFLPPLPDNQRSSPRQMESGKCVSSLRQSSASSLPSGTESLYVPKPPSNQRTRPSSARPSQRGTWANGVKRRVQSANGVANGMATFTLSPQQKELLVKIQQKKERQAKEDEQKKKEEEEQKRQDNELAFQSWLVRKRDQLQEERRVQKAQEMERMSGKRECGDPELAFKKWLQKKHQQQVKDKQVEDMRRLERESGFSLHSREDSEKAFRRWLRRKRLEKRAEQQAARERSRRLFLEERRARRMHDLQCTIYDIKTYSFSDPYGYRY